MHVRVQCCHNIVIFDIGKGWRLINSAENLCSDRDGANKVLQYSFFFLLIYLFIYF